MSDEYRRFLERKATIAASTGFHVDQAELHPWLKPHARAIVQWGLRGGRRAYFTAYGLGKTSMQLETGRQVLRREGGLGLIVAPLGVRVQFRLEAAKMAIELPFIRSVDETTGPGLYLTNYETVRDGKIDPAAFTFASLDEADCLRSYGSKTFQEFLPAFEPVPYRFVASATPSPNRFKELIHYAGFLGVMDTGQALTRFFQRDPQKAGNLQLYPHKEREFWLWVASWAIFLQNPSELGYSDDGYELPPLTVRWHEVKTDLSEDRPDRDGQHALFRDAVLGVQNAAREKRSSLDARIAKVAEIRRAEPHNRFIIWHDLEDERHAIQRAIPEAVSVYGSQPLEDREQAIVDFGEGRITDLSAKPVIAGAGTNLQHHCHRAIFAGIGFKFRDFAQAIHRIQRFQQPHPVEIDIVYAETERMVRRDLEAKWARDKELRDQMSAIITEYGLDKLSMADTLRRSIGVERIEVTGEHFLAANNDCVVECRAMDTDSVDLVVTSIPFANHYEYTPSYNDFGRTDNNEHFWAQMDHLTPELLRILRPGRLACIHVKDRILFGNVTGAGVPTASPFHAEAIFHGRRHGFDYMGLITIVTDVVRENNQTYRLGWSENAKDGTKMGVGSPEYVVLLRKPQTDRGRGYADIPVAKDKTRYTRARWQVDAHAMWRSSGDRLLTAEDMAAMSPGNLASVFTEQSLRAIYDFEHHVRIGEDLDARGALPATFMSLAPGSHRDDCWHDVLRMLTLNGSQAAKGREQHVCPLQFDIVDRLIDRYSNTGELVFDPFGGLMTVPYRALHKGRRGRGVELNTAYFLDGVAYLEAAEREIAIPSLFDFAGMREREAA